MTAPTSNPETVSIDDLTIRPSITTSMGVRMGTQIIAAAITLATILGLIVLIALNDITAAEGLPLIGGLAGFHGGAILGSSNNA